jgi:hypothetical protein
MVPVQVSAVVTDTCGEATWKIISISSSDGGSSDWKITGDATAQLRAARSGTNKAGRVYTITIQATDESGNVSETKTVTVTVPRDNGKGMLMQSFFKR